MNSRDKRKARIISLQVIYAYELHGSRVEQTLEQFFLSTNDSSDKSILLNEAEFISKDIIKYSKKLATLVLKYSSEIDKIIIDRSKNWDFERITLIDKLILRMALVEMTYIDNIPPKVSITEAVEIAKQFSTEDSSAFINGILDSFYNQVLISKEKI